MGTQSLSDRIPVSSGCIEVYYWPFVLSLIDIINGPGPVKVIGQLLVQTPVV